MTVIDKELVRSAELVTVTNRRGAWLNQILSSNVPKPLRQDLDLSHLVHL